MAQKQAQRATELWQVSKQQIVELKEQLQDHQPLGLPQPNDAPKSSTPQPLVSHSVEAATQTDEAFQPASNPVEVSTQTEMEQPPVSTSTEKSK